jgi:aminomethyltransferase
MAGAETLKKTPVADQHVRLGARMTDFGGWWMPVNYKPGILAEHHATRDAVGVFDVSHMGEFHFRGPRAREAVQRLVTNDVGRLEDGAALYTVACLPTGGIVDDLIVYRLADDHYLTVVNAANIDKDWGHFQQATGSTCDLADESEATGLIAYQGPRAEETLGPLCTADLSRLAGFRFFLEVELAGHEVTIARTGYTGEDGFEIFCRREDAAELFARLASTALAVGGAPVGLGARDTLRLEARLPLYGNDLDESTTPYEAGLGWVVKAAGFIGHEALARQKAEGVRRKLTGFTMRGRGIARHGYEVFAGDTPGAPPIGTVTSGGVGPTVGQNIGLAYLPPAAAAKGQRFFVDCRGKMVEAEVFEGAFYRRRKSP